MKKRVIHNSPSAVVAPPLRALLDDITQAVDLPDGGTELLLIELDPHRAHVYWQLDPADYDPERYLCLRVYDITNSGLVEQPEQVFDVAVQGDHGNWYLDFWRDNRIFIAEIGYRDQPGAFEPITRSNEVRTPVAEPPVAPAEPAHQAPDGQALHTDLPDHVAYTRTAEADKKSAPNEEPEQASGAAETNNEPNPERSPAPIEPADLLNPAFPLADWLEQQLTLAVEGDQDAQEESGITPAVMEAAGEAMMVFADEEEAGTVVEAESVFPDASLLLDVVAENHAAVMAFYEAVAACPPPELQAAETDEVEQQSKGAETAASTSPSTTPPPPRTLALEHAIGISSSEFAARRELLEVQAELHVYGRTDPSNRLTLYGQTIKVEADGSFSIRRNIPAGAMVIPLLAQQAP